MQRRKYKLSLDENGIKIVAMGDSITMGAHVEKEKAYPAILETLLRERFKGLEIDVENHGYGGETTLDGQRRLSGEILSSKPHIVVIGYGMNDSVLTGVSEFRVGPSLFQMTLTDIIDKLKDAGAIVVLNTVTPVIPDFYYERHPKEYYEPFGGVLGVLRMYNEIIYMVGQATKCSVIDMATAFNDDCEGIRRHGDGVHPNEKGHVLIARAVFRTLAEIIEVLV